MKKTMKKIMKKTMKKAYVVIAVLIALAPLFAWAADKVGYSEPLENAAEEAGAEENSILSGLLPDYTVPGMNPYISAIIAGAIGCLIILLLAIVIEKLFA